MIATEDKSDLKDETIEDATENNETGNENVFSHPRRTSPRTPPGASPTHSLNPNVIKMHACKLCGKQFTSGNALGGHLSKFHRKRNN